MPQFPSLPAKRFAYYAFCFLFFSTLFTLVLLIILYFNLLSFRSRSTLTKLKKFASSDIHHLEQNIPNLSTLFAISAYFFLTDFFVYFDWKKSKYIFPCFRKVFKMYVSNNISLSTFDDAKRNQRLCQWCCQNICNVSPRGQYWAQSCLTSSSMIWMKS